MSVIEAAQVACGGLPPPDALDRIKDCDVERATQRAVVGNREGIVLRLEHRIEHFDR